MGLASVARRLAASPGVIAYAGASVTVQKHGYRTALHDALCRRFGHGHRSVNAGFGGVGSVVSVAMMDRLVLRHWPDLCFIECQTGDLGLETPGPVGSALEAMVAKLRQKNCEPCFLNLPRQDIDYAAQNDIVTAYREVAEHHQVAVIDLAARFQGLGSGFFRDVVHTTAEGGRQTAEAIIEALEALWAQPGAQAMARPIFSQDFRHAHLADISAEMVRGANTRSLFRLTLPVTEVAPGGVICVRAAAQSIFGLLLIYGPHSGEAMINGRPRLLRDKWCDQDRMHGYLLEPEIAPGYSLVVEPRAPLKIAGLFVR